MRKPPHLRIRKLADDIFDRDTCCSYEGCQHLATHEIHLNHWCENAPLNLCGEHYVSTVEDFSRDVRSIASGPGVTTHDDAAYHRLIS